MFGTSTSRATHSLLSQTLYASHLPYYSQFCSLTVPTGNGDASARSPRSESQQDQVLSRTTRFPFKLEGLLVPRSSISLSHRPSQVFSLSRNRIAVLPPYIAQFQNLRILKVDQNPFEYPPMSVMDPKGDLRDQKLMESWIESVRQWLKAYSRHARRSSVDSTASEQKLASR